MLITFSFTMWWHICNNDANHSILFLTCLLLTFNPSKLPLCPVCSCCALLLLSLPFATIAAAFFAAPSITAAISIFHCSSNRFGLLLLSLLAVPIYVFFIVKWMVLTIGFSFVSTCRYEILLSSECVFFFSLDLVKTQNNVICMYFLSVYGDLLTRNCVLLLWLLHYVSMFHGQCFFSLELK